MALHEDFECVGVGNTWSDYRCNRCGAVYTFDMEDVVGAEWECPACKAKDDAGPRYQGIRMAAWITRDYIDSMYRTLAMRGGQPHRPEHVRALCNDIIDGRVTGAKAHRYLGWAQCAVSLAGAADVGVFRRLNKRWLAEEKDDEGR